MKFTRLSGALLAVALPFSVAGVASAQQPDTRFVLTVSSPDGRSESVKLTCDPAGGSHPHARRACAELHAAKGQFDSLPGDPGQVACTMEYQPLVATAKGKWRGKPVSWQSEFGNDCTLRTATGAVFLF